MATPAMDEVNSAILKSMENGVARNLSKILDDNKCTVRLDYAYLLLKAYQDRVEYQQTREGRCKKFIKSEKGNKDDRPIRDVVSGEVCG